MERGRLAAIEVEELRAGYGRTVVLDGIDLAVTAGEFVAILKVQSWLSQRGRSWASSTTIRRALTHFPREQRVRVPRV